VSSSTSHPQPNAASNATGVCSGYSPISATAETEPETFDRAYVENLRAEAAEHRVKGKRADALAARLVTSLAASTGRLADPSDLPYDAALLDDDGMPDGDKVTEAVEALLAAKPHLASRRPTGDVGQGARSEAEGVSLAGLLRAGAGR
jgi:hypothetical protein